METLAKDLRSLLAAGSLEADPAVYVKCSRDWWSQTLWWDETQIKEHTPQVVARPGSAEETARLLSWAQERGVAIVPRGGGSGVSGSAIPPKRDSIVIETARLNKITGLDPLPQGAEITVGAGYFGGELEAALNQKGYSLMHIPASLEISTVGGWIACGSYGQLSTLYGGIGDQVDTVQVALPNGRVEQASSKDFLLSEGMLGIITQATLRVKKSSNKHYFLSCDFDGIEEGLAFVHGLIKDNLRPAVARLYDPLEAKSTGLAYEKKPFLSEQARFNLRVFLLKHPALVRLMRQMLSHKKWLLIMVFEEHQADIYAQVSERVRVSALKTSDKAGHVWLAKRSQWNTDKMMKLFEADCFVDTLDTWGPWDKLAAIYHNVIKAASGYATSMGHASHYTKDGACLYFIFAGRGTSRKDSIRLHQNAWRAAMEACIASGGLVNHHHGVGYAKLPWIKHAYQGGELQALTDLKKRLDPKGIMNPGKIL